VPAAAALTGEVVSGTHLQFAYRSGEGGAVQVGVGSFVISVPLICTGVPTLPSAHAKVTLAVVSVRAMSLLFGDAVPRREQFLSRPLEVE
jgi:hypothetical protein